MTSRRAFLGLAGGAPLLAAFRDDALPRVLAAGRDTAGAAPETVAADESYWREIQQVFTVNRSYVNLNNGGVCPSPRVVQEAMKRYLDLSNEAPVYSMWQLLEPQVESVRRALARDFGCDPEEMAVTRNASEGLVLDAAVGYGAHCNRSDACCSGCHLPGMARAILEFDRAHPLHFGRAGCGSLCVVAELLESFGAAAGMSQPLPQMQ